MIEGRCGVTRQCRQPNQGIEADNARSLFLHGVLHLQVNLGRAARTDAGVHAAGNVVSMKMIMDVPGVPDMVSRINEELPPEIRLWGFVRIFHVSFLHNSLKFTESRK